MTRSIEWVAGLFEGEGCFGIACSGKKSHMLYLRLIVSMTDEDVIRTLHETVGVGISAQNRQTKVH